MTRLLILGFLLAGLAACASPAKVENMIAPKAVQTASGSPLANSICVTSVTGGEETNPLWTSEVDNAAFKGALEGSLRNNGLAAAPSSCRYDLEANMLGLAQPIAGFDMTVTANVNYSVLDHQSRDAYFQSTVATPYTATVGDAFAGVKRLRLANEGAVKANIAKFIGELNGHAATNPPDKGAAAPTS